MSIPTHADVVAHLHAAEPPARTVEGALAFVLRVIAQLQAAYPHQRVGLLIKTAGENIVPYGGTSVSAGRLVYPDHNLLVKILTDIPTTNGPSWQPEIGIPTEGHHGGYLAVNGDDEPAVHDGDSNPLALLEGKVDTLEGHVEDLFALHRSVNGQLGAQNRLQALQDGRVQALEVRVLALEQRPTTPSPAPAKPWWWPL